METLLQDIKYGVRTLLKKPGFTVVAVVALALGIGANTAIFTVVNAVLLSALPFRNADEVVMVWEHNRPRDRRENVISPANYLDWQDQNTVFAEMGAFYDGRANLTGFDTPEEIPVQAVTSNIFQLLGANPVVGRTFAADEGTEGKTNIVVLSHSLWQRRYGGDPSIVGQTIQLNGNNYTIIGVMPRNFTLYIKRGTLSGKQADAWRPIAFTAQHRVRQGRFMSAVARLKPGVTVEQAQAEMNAIAGRLEEQYKEFNNGWGVNIVPIKDQLVGEIRPALLVLLGAVAFVLLIACANVANLLLARAASRQKEIAIRTALGAGRWRVVRQLLTESVLLATVGGVLGLLLAMWGTDLLLALSPKDLLGIKDIGINPQVLGFTLIVSLLTGIIFGLVPALTASRANLNLALKEGGKTSAADGGHSLRNLFVVAQVALALVLLIGSGLMIKSFMRLQSVNPGFNSENLLTVRMLLPASKYREDHQVISFFNQIVGRVETIPGVRSASAINFLPFTGLAAATGFTVVGHPQPGVGEEPGTEVRVAQPGYFETMGIPIIKGRTFTDKEATELSHVVIVNEAMVKEHFPNQDPLGQKLLIDMMDKPAPCEIIGVVGDVKHHGLDTEVRPFAYWPPPELTYSFMSIVVRTDSDPDTIAAAIQREVSVMDKDLPIADVRMMQDLISESVSRSRFSTLLLTIFAGVALVLAAVGIYGVMSYSVTQRTHEIGIRMALGAGRSNVLRLVVGRGMLLTAIGLAIGLGASFALTRFLSSMLFGISAVDPITFAMVTAVLGSISLAACYIPALKATKVDPMIALRYE